MAPFKSLKIGGDNVEFKNLITFIGLIASLSSIVFAFLAYKRSEHEQNRKEGKNEGLILSDIGYIKACVDRVEKNLVKVDEKYQMVVERLVKLEETVANLEKRVDLNL